VFTIGRLCTGPAQENAVHNFAANAPNASSSPHRAAMEIGELFTRQWAIEDGSTDRELTAQVRAGAISRVARGVYRLGPGFGPDPEAVVKSLKVRLSHESAAAWYGASLITAPDRLHVTATRCRGRWADELPGVRFHRGQLDPSEVRVVRGIPITSPIRTGLDVARSLPLEHSVAALDSLARRGVITPAAMQCAAAALPNGPGRRAAVTAASLIDPLAESVFESMGRVRIVTAGLPAPESQVTINDRDGMWIARVDFAWRAYRLVLECDGYEFHGTREAFERDRRRWTALIRAGWRVVVVTWRQLMDEPDYLVDVLSDLLV